jgi:hypothetical protein
VGNLRRLARRSEKKNHRDSLSTFPLNNMQIGDLVLYDKFGAPWQSVSPSFYQDDFGFGVVLSVASSSMDDLEDTTVEIIKEDGKTAYFSKSYIIAVDTDFHRFQRSCTTIDHHTDE